MLELIVDLEFYNKDGVPISWVQAPFITNSKVLGDDDEPGTVYSQIKEWALETYPEDGTPRIKNIWTINYNNEV